MDTPGKIIKTERERQNRSLHEISDRLKLSNDYLNAIEQDNYAYLPAEVFAKAYLRLYADELGLDGNSVVDLYHSMGKEDEDENEHEHHLATETGKDHSEQKSVTSVPMAVFSSIQSIKTSLINGFASLGKRASSHKIDLRSIKNIVHSLNINFSSARDAFSFMTALKFLLIAVFAVSVITTIYMLNNPDTPVQAMPSVTHQDSVAGTQGNVMPSVSFEETTLEKPLQANSSEAYEKHISRKTEIQDSNILATAVDTEEIKLQTVETMNKKMVLKIIAEEHTWASIGIDGGEQSDKLLRAGETITLNADEHFNLKIGNAGGTKLILNGKELEKFGPYGKVVSLKLP